MIRATTGRNVFDEAVDRLARLYADGHRLVVSFSAGKDSGVCLELAIIAVRMTNRLPVDVVIRDEEVMYPGTYEYAERVHDRPEVAMRWLVAHQPIVNVFNRAMPYYWVFDPQLPPSEWVREPPPYAETIPEQNITAMVTPARFPPAPSKTLYAVIGLRVQESRARLFGLASSGGYLTKPNPYGVVNCRPIYDWRDGDIWKAIRDNAWDYNAAYDTMARLGVRRDQLRIAPPAMNAAGAVSLQIAAIAWPRWFDRVARRLPGTRLVSNFGRRAITPTRRLGETWEQTFQREVMGDHVPQWIRDRATIVVRKLTETHAGHATGPLPDVTPCYRCVSGIGSWKQLTLILWGGDPFASKAHNLIDYVEPEFFRPGAGKWGGKPQW